MALGALRRLRYACVAVIVLACVVGAGRTAAALTAPVTPTPTSYSFSQSALVGAGFQNVIAEDPRHNGVLLSGADVAGINRSTDFGVHWTPAQRGYTSLSQQNTSAILFDPGNPNTVYAAYGTGGGGGVMMSGDNGQSWSVIPGAPPNSGPGFDGGNHSAPGGGTGMERCTGHMLALDTSVSPHVLYAVGAVNGVWQLGPGGWRQLVTRAQLGGSNGCATSMVWGAPGILEVSTWNHGIFEVNVGAGTVRPVPSAPPVVQELVALPNGEVWGAAYATGVGRFRAGTGWQTVLPSGGERYMSIDGYVAGGQSTVIAGSDTSQPVAGSSVRATLHRTTNGGASWSALPSGPGQVSDELLGPQTGNHWWRASDASTMIGSRFFIPSSIVVDHGAAGDDLWVSGFGGDWRLLGQEQQNVLYPSDTGLGVTLNHQVVIDPTTRGATRVNQRTYSGNTDWIFFSSSDGLSTQAGIDQSKPVGSESAGYATVVDGYPSTPIVYLGSGFRDGNSSGEIFAAAAPATTAAAFHSLGLAAVAHGARPTGLAVVDTTGTPTVVVATEGAGVYTKTGSEPWQQDGSLFTDDAPPGNMLAVGSGAEGRTVYAYDPAIGILRSRNAGLPGSWQVIWHQTGGDGALMVDRVTPTRLWFSGAGGLYRFDDAASATFGSVSPLVTGATGPITQRGGIVYTTRFVPGGGTQLLQSDSAQQDFTDVGDVTLHSLTGKATGMDMADDGTVYIAFSGSGIVVGQPGGVPPTPPSVTITAPGSGASVSGPLTVSGTSTAGSEPVAEIDVEVDGGKAVVADGTDSWTAAIDSTAYGNGPHTVNATAIDVNGASTTRSTDVVFDNPVAVATGDCDDLHCSFDASGSSPSQGNDLATYTWDFGDGSTGTGAAPEHDYDAAGTYTYRLTVTDSTGLTSAPVTGTVTPRSPPTVTIATPSAGSTVSGTVTVTGTATAGSADLDHVDVSVDGGTAQQAVGTSTWSAHVDLSAVSDGDHTIVAQATATDGLTHSTSIPINVPPNQPPTAAASVTCAGLHCDFDGSGSTDADGTVASYTWDFGDGSTATGPTAHHHYSSASASYTYTLTVTDDRGASDTATDMMSPTDAPPVAAANVSCNARVCSFDASSSSDSDGTIASYAWDFGDGNGGTSASASHTYEVAQPYQYSLTVTDDDGATDTFQGTVTPTKPNPVAVASASCAGLTCTFDGSSSYATGGTITKYVWDFGDASGGSGAGPIHTYRAAKQYQYSLTVTEADGATATTTGTISPTDRPPVAAATAKCQVLTCSFDGSASTDSDGTVASYAWKFGDGATSTLASPRHTYTAPGTYTYSLTVTDDQGIAGVAATGTVKVPVAAIGFRDVSHAYVAATVASGGSVKAPSTVQPRDTELLFVASTAAGATGTPTGWTLVKQQSTTPLQVKVFKRAAVAGDAGATVRVPVLAAAGVALELVDYSGVAPSITAVGSSGGIASVSHSTPRATVAVAGSWVLSYWADMSSTTSGWTLPAPVTSRDVVVGTGKSYASAALADSGKAVAVGAASGRTASVTGGTSSKAAMLTVVLPPALS